MKIYHFYIVCSLSLMVLFSSCGSGLSEEQKNEVEKFETEWTANITFANYFYEQISETEKKLQDKIVANNSVLIDSALQNTPLNNTELNNLKNEYFSILKLLEKENTGWLKMKQEAMNDEMEWSAIEEIITQKKEILISTQKRISEGLKKQEQIRKENNLN